MHHRLVCAGGYIAPGGQAVSELIYISDGIRHRCQDPAYCLTRRSIIEMPRLVRGID